MSADNGLLLWQGDDEYVLSEYSGSRDYDSYADMRRLDSSRDLIILLERAQEALRGGVEYGLQLDVKDFRGDASGAEEVVEASVDAGPRARPSVLAEPAERAERP